MNSKELIQPYHYISFKKDFEDQLQFEWHSLKDGIKIIANEMARFCELHNMPFTITDILSDLQEDLNLGRVSTSHREGRAFDFRIHKWSEKFKKLFEQYFEHRYKHVAAISKASGLPNLILYHDVAHGLHGHCQIKPE